jgi:hypothetical protein
MADTVEHLTGRPRLGSFGKMLAANMEEALTASQAAAEQPYPSPGLGLGSDRQTEHHAGQRRRTRAAHVPWLFAAYAGY